MKDPTSCRTVREGLTEYLENALPSAARQGFDEHFSSCSDCRRLREELSALIGQLPHLPREKMPEDVKDFIKKSLPLGDARR